MPGGIFCGGPLARTCHRIGASAVLGEQSQVARAGYGLGAVGRAKLAQDAADVLLDRVNADEQFPGYGVNRCARGEHRQHLQLTAGKRLDQARYRRAALRPEPGTLSLPSHACTNRARQPSGTRRAGACFARWAAASRPGGHPSGPHIGEDPYLALRAGEGERLHQGGHRGGLVVAGLVRWGLQRAYLGNTADPPPGCRLGEHPVEQREGLAWAALREQHPRQHQIFPLLGEPDPARRPRAARTAPGHCHRRLATARPPVGRRAEPSRPAGQSCRIRPGRRRGPARAPPSSSSPATSRGRGTNPAAEGHMQLGGRQDILAGRGSPGHRHHWLVSDR